MKKEPVLIGLGSTLIILQVLSIMGNAKAGVSFSFSFANIPSFLYSLMYALGYYFIGLLGIIMLLLGLSAKRKSHEKPAPPIQETAFDACEHISSVGKHTKSNHRVKVYTKETQAISNKSPSAPCPRSNDSAPIRKTRYKVLFIIFLVLFVASLIGNIFLFINNSALNKEISSLEINISDLNKEKNHYYGLLTNSQHEVDFYETRIAICDSSKKLYHTIDCSAAMSFLAKYSIDYFYLDAEVAEQYGYSPCDSCKPAQNIK